MHALVIAGFDGEILNFSDPYVQGPVLNTGSRQKFIDARCQFLINDYGINRPDFKAFFCKGYDNLELAKNYDRVCIW